MSRVLAVDPGERRIGLALSDPTRLLARPLQVLAHVSRPQDAQAIAEAAERHSASLILIGLALDQEGEAGPQARKALRLAEAVRSATDLPVETWDESGTTRMAIQQGGDDDLLDARAAAFILQDYLDARAQEGGEP